jgi:hypothetical protein
MNKETLRMQMLAGVITEGQYKSRLNETFNPFLDTEEGGYMREYIDDVVSSMGGEAWLDLEYRSDFDLAFHLALKQLKIDHPELDFEAIKANKEAFWG